jgi:hypothetical protein
VQFRPLERPVATARDGAGAAGLVGVVLVPVSTKRSLSGLHGYPLVGQTGGVLVDGRHSEDSVEVAHYERAKRPRPSTAIPALTTGPPGQI